MKHTPGPWTAVTYDNGSFDIEAEVSKHWRFVICARNSAGDRSEESKANAQLIVAAPEMLTLLKILTEGHTDLMRYIEAVEETIKLIEKIEGK